MESAVQPAYLVPENVKADVLFRNMREKKESIAIVLDEYSGVCGIVTLTDLIECLIGDIDLEEETEEEAVVLIEKIAENAWNIMGSAPLSEVEEELGIIFEDTESETFSGYALGLYGSIPEDGSTFELSTDQIDIDIREIKDHKIEKAIVVLKAVESDENEESGVSAS